MKSNIPENEKGGLVEYHLDLNGERVLMNELIGKRIKISYQNQINCISCGRKSSKSFAQGYCYPCFISLPETDSCILRPETCEAHLGKSRDMEWAEGHCLVDHIVYLALSPSLKVGVTRHTQIPTRWIDQGAWEAIPLARTPNRYSAGKIEVYLKNYLSDKTNWRHMLTGVRFNDIDLSAEKRRVIDLIPDEFMTSVINDIEITSIDYPVQQFPLKVYPVNFESTPVVEGGMTGIKGQYLLFENGQVLNIRKYGGYLINLEV